MSKHIINGQVVDFARAEQVTMVGDQTINNRKVAGLLSLAVDLQSAASAFSKHLGVRGAMSFTDDIEVECVELATAC